MPTSYDFDTPVDRSGFLTAKWDAEIARTGHADLLAFGTADMDFLSPPQIVRALEERARCGHFGYPLKSGSYFEAITGYFSRRFNWSIDHAWIQTGNGIYASMEAILAVLTEPGDEVVIQSPVHHIFRELVEASGRVVLDNPLTATPAGYHMDLDHLESKINSRTKALILCNPHNPVGRAWSREELSELQAVCLANNVTVISDEVYGGLMYPGAIFTPMASISQEASANTITLTSASKSFNLTGLKHSIVIAENECLRDLYLKGQRRSNMYFGGSIFGQVATEIALRDCDAWSESLMEYTSENWKFTADYIKKILPLVNIAIPDSTYFLWMDLSKYATPSSEWVEKFENISKISLSDGRTFGPSGDRHFRLNLACPRALLLSGLERMSLAAAAMK